MTVEEKIEILKKMNQSYYTYQRKYVVLFPHIAFKNCRKIGLLKGWSIVENDGFFDAFLVDSITRKDLKTYYFEKARHTVPPYSLEKIGRGEEIELATVSDHPTDHSFDRFGFFRKDRKQGAAA